MASSYRAGVHAANATRLLTAAAKTVLLILAMQHKHGVELAQAERAYLMKPFVCKCICTENCGVAQQAARLGFTGLIRGATKGLFLWRRRHALPRSCDA